MDNKTITIEEVKLKLKDIAKELDKDFEHIDVLHEYQNRYGGLYGKVADEIFAIYTKNWIPIYDENGNIIKKNIEN